MKQKTSFTLSAECSRLLRVLAVWLGVSQAAVIELLVREKARKEGIDDPHENPTVPPNAG